MPDPIVTVLAPGVSGEDALGRRRGDFAKANAERARVAEERMQRAGRAGGYAPKRRKPRTPEKQLEYNRRWENKAKRARRRASRAD
jgi:hypothetical protein